MGTAIAVIGASRCSAAVAANAERVGRLIAERGAAVICGGLGGVMEAACRGAKQAGGVTIGILPGDRTADANAFVDFRIATGLGEARNVVIIKSADGVIAIDGSYGTLLEIAFALKLNKPIVGLGTWSTESPTANEVFVVPAGSADEAVDLLFALIG